MAHARPDVARFYAVCVTISLFSAVYAKRLIPDDQRFKFVRLSFHSLSLSAHSILSGFEVSFTIESFSSCQVFWF